MGYNVCSLSPPPGPLFFGDTPPLNRLHAPSMPCPESPPSTPSTNLKSHRVWPLMSAGGGTASSRSHGVTPHSGRPCLSIYFKHKFKKPDNTTTTTKTLNYEEDEPGISPPVQSSHSLLPARCGLFMRTFLLLILALKKIHSYMILIIFFEIF